MNAHGVAFESVNRCQLRNVQVGLENLSHRATQLDQYSIVFSFTDESLIDERHLQQQQQSDYSVRNVRAIINPNVDSGAKVDFTTGFDKFFVLVQLLDTCANSVICSAKFCLSTQCDVNRQMELIFHIPVRHSDGYFLARFKASIYSYVIHNSCFEDSFTSTSAPNSTSYAVPKNIMPRGYGDGVGRDRYPNKNLVKEFQKKKTLILAGRLFRVGIIGGTGNIGLSLLHALIKSPYIVNSEIYVHMHSSRNLEKIKATGARIVRHIMDIFAQHECRIVFVCLPRRLVYNLHSRNEPLCGNFLPVPHLPITIVSCVTGVSPLQFRFIFLNRAHLDCYNEKIMFSFLLTNVLIKYQQGLLISDIDFDTMQFNRDARFVIADFGSLYHYPTLTEDHQKAVCTILRDGLYVYFELMGQLLDKCAFLMPGTRSKRFFLHSMIVSILHIFESRYDPSQLLAELRRSFFLREFISDLDKLELHDVIVLAIEAQHQTE